jgi:hypothetical protein
MANTAYLASVVVTGAVLLGVWAFVARMENWRHYEPASGRAGRETARSSDSRRADATESVGAWIAGFLLLVAVAGGGAVLLVSDAALTAALGGWVALAAVFGVLLGAFLLWGTYSSARHRGLPSAHAALLSAWLFGSLFVTVIAVNLVIAG